MDIVIAYCNQNDVVWQKEYNDTIKKYKMDFPGSNNFNRFSDMNTLQYLLRSVDKYMSDIDNVFLVVSGPTQVPKWINKKTVKVIYHENFIPKKYLPTFSARTIETFLHFIPGLGEKFLYFNDDMIILQECNESDFFTNDGGIKVNFVIDEIWKNKKDKVYGFVYHRDCVEAAKKAGKKHDTLDIIRTDHGPYPLYKSLYQNFYNDVKDCIDDHITKFRSDKEIDLHFRSCAYLYYMNKVEKNSKMTNYIVLPYDAVYFQECINCLQRSNIFLSCCVQDSYRDMQEQQEFYYIINEALHSRFPNMCKYEWCNPVIQVIVKNENEYLREWIDHHLSLGINRIFILDNNDIDGEKIPDDILQIPQVVVINYRGKKVIQNKAYTDIANKINYNFYTHLITIDADEFLVLDKFKNIQDYLTYYKIHNADQIKLNWRLYLDDGTIYGDPNIPVKDRCVNFVDNNSELGLFENSNSKSIISLKDNLDRKISWRFLNPHYANSDTKTITVNNCGLYSSNTIRIGVNYDCAYINHYRFKSTEEMCKKMARGYPDQHIKRELIIAIINRYLKINGYSFEKLKCIKSYFSWFTDAMISEHYDYSKPPIKKHYPIIEKSE